MQTTPLLTSGLYLVATPIGNLSELSPRAVAVLQKVECILCEDTRHSRRLLNHFGIHKPLEAHHRFNEQAQRDSLLRRLQNGMAIALISDAGAPAIADPGNRLVAACHAHNISVIPIGGLSAIITAVMASGMAEEGFVFAGFAPSKTTARRTWLSKQLVHGLPLVIFEAPHRLLGLLQDLAHIAGHDHHLCLARELSKRFEQIRSTTVAELLTWATTNPDNVRGECTLVLAPLHTNEEDTTNFSSDLTTAARLCTEYSIPVASASAMLARISGHPKRLCYQICLDMQDKHAD